MMSESASAEELMTEFYETTSYVQPCARRGFFADKDPIDTEQIESATVPLAISRRTNMNQYVDGIMRKWAKKILTGDGVCVQDNDEEMNWRLFFAHSQDMQGFAADVFIGGANERNHPSNGEYQGLRDRWTNSRSMMDGLARLWESPVGQASLRYWSNSHRHKEDRAKGVQPLMALLRGSEGNEATRMFADTLGDLTGHRIARTTNSMIRAYCQNSSILRELGFSFRDYLMEAHPVPSSAEETASAETAWITSIVRDFYFVGEVMANYLICDWLLGLWRKGEMEWFGSYKPDSVHLRVIEEGKLPEDARDFKNYSRALSMLPNWVPEAYPELVGKPVPPRLLNEAIWLEENRSSQPDTIVHFQDDDAGYALWLAENSPRGFVVNSFREPSTKYLILHRSSCHTISGAPAPGKTWMREYSKTCSASIEKLDRWAKESLGGSLRPCGRCKP
jgi:hypothetical protein